jgi:hypothetical protein
MRRIPVPLSELAASRQVDARMEIPGSARLLRSLDGLSGFSGHRAAHKKFPDGDILIRN